VAIFDWLIFILNGYCVHIYFGEDAEAPIIMDCGTLIFETVEIISVIFWSVKETGFRETSITSITFSILGIIVGFISMEYGRRQEKKLKELETESQL